MLVEAELPLPSKPGFGGTGMDYAILADWEINRFCNFKCQYCFDGCEGGSDLQRKSFKGHNISKIIKAFNNFDLIWWIHMSGGEPFIQPDFVNLCKGLEKHYISFNTNLSANNIGDFAENVNPKRVAFLHCSLHIDERKRLDLVPDFIEKYHLLKNCGFNAYITQVMHPPIIKRFDKLFNYFLEKGLIIRPKTFRGYYHGRLYPAGYSIQERRCIQKYSRLSEELSPLDMATQIDPRLDKEFLEGDLSFKGVLCNAGRKSVTISCNGDVRRCHGSSARMGNIFEGKIEFLPEAKICCSDICPCPYYGLNFSLGDARIIKNRKIIDRLKYALSYG